MIIDDLLKEMPTDFEILSSEENKFELKPVSTDETMDSRSKIVTEKFGKKSNSLRTLIKNYRINELKFETKQQTGIDENENKKHGYLVWVYKVDQKDNDLTIYYFIKSAYSPKYSYVSYAQIYRPYNQDKSILMDDMLTWPVIIRDNICSDS